LLRHYFPGRIIEYPALQQDDLSSYEKMDELVETLAAEVEYIQHVQMLTFARAIVKAFNGE